MPVVPQRVASNDHLLLLLAGHDHDGILVQVVVRSFPLQTIVVLGKHRIANLEFPGPRVEDQGGGGLDAAVVQEVQLHLGDVGRLHAAQLVDVGANSPVEMRVVTVTQGWWKTSLCYFPIKINICF